MPTSSSDAKYILVSNNLNPLDKKRKNAYKQVATSHRVSYDTEQEAIVAARDYMRKQFKSVKHGGVMVCKVLRLVPHPELT